jgi:hypothetical protein
LKLFLFSIEALSLSEGIKHRLIEKPEESEEVVGWEEAARNSGFSSGTNRKERGWCF